MGLSPLMLFAFTVSLFHLSHIAHSSVCHDDEAFALLQFNQSLTIDKDSCPFEYSKLVSWNLDGENSTDCCSWDGVVCDNYTGHVVELDLSSSCLHGSINSSSTLFQLVHLEWLSLAANNFSYSHIPYGIRNLSKLSYLDLSFSSFSGQIPSEMLELSQLQYLDLSSNSDVRNSLQLRQPSLRNLVEKLTNLKWLDLSDVNISSPIPNSLANLSSLTYLSLHDCQLQGMIPTSIGNLTNLVHLRIYDNNIVGELPISIGNLACLQELDLSFNQLSSSQAISSLGNLAQLSYLDFSYNNFSSQALLSSLGNLTQLSYLDFSNNNFSNGNSSLWSWIGKQSQLSYLSLSHVNFAGEIPFWLVNLTNLTDLKMSQNQLNGSISYWLMNLNQLSTLDLGSNHLTGQIPYQIINLTQLIYLDLSSNRLQGPIPSSISELKNLQYLNLYSNNLNGTVELDMYLKLESLHVLVLSSNNLWVLTKNTVNTTGSGQNINTIGLGSCNLTVFPNFLKNHNALLGLDLSSNNISGQIPGWLLNISVGLLQSLNLSNNLLTGFEQHHVVLPWTDLKTLDLRSNKLEGSLPLPASSVNIYLASNNKLSGEIPPWICNLTQLQALDLSYNNLSGALPQCLGHFSNYLSILGLQSNNFCGSIPQLFMSGSSLRMVDLSRNRLKGKVPRSLTNCRSLEFLNIGYNQITGTFPSWLGILSELKVLILKSNRFYGVITEPKTNFEFMKLHVIDFSHNMFTGELPSNWISMKVVNESQLTYMEDSLQASSLFYYAYFDLASYAYAFMMNNKGIEIAYGKISNKLTSIVLSGNKFTGEIPASIFNLKALKNLNLSNNNLFGCISSSLSNLTELESLDLSNNKLSGKIPQELVALTSLEFINVSHNNLKGRIPEGYQFDTFENSSFEGNPGLCGKPLSKSCENSEASQRAEDGVSESEWEWESTFAFDWEIVMIGVVSGLIVGVILGNEYFTNITEWFARISGRQLIRVKRRRMGQRN